jgi:diacylglycerol kinase family enzyme
LPAKVDVIVNRCAHHLVGDAGTRGSLLGAARGRATVHETRSLEELGSVARALAERGSDAVLLAGGDGSYMAGTTALVAAFGGALPRIGFAPGGTVSTVARNWGFRGREGAYAARVVRAAVDGTARVTRRPTLRVRDDEGGDRVGFIFGAGLVASFFDAYYSGGTLGYGAAAGIVAKVFAGSFYGGALASRVLARTPASLTVDGHTVAPRAFSLVAASVVRDLGLHMLVLYRAAERADRFHLVASPLPARALGPQLPRVLLGRRLRGEGHVDVLADEAELAFEGGRGTYVLDGDVFSTSRVRVSVGPVLDYLSA